MISKDDEKTVRLEEGGNNNVSNEDHNNSTELEEEQTTDVDTVKSYKTEKKKKSILCRWSVGLVILTSAIILVVLIGGKIVMINLDTYNIFSVDVITFGSKNSVQKKPPPRILTTETGLWKTNLPHLYEGWYYLLLKINFYKF